MTPLKNEVESLGMKIGVVIARILMGAIFLILGLNGFLQFLPAPPIAGPAGQFLGSMMSTHYTWMVSGVQVLAALMLLANRYVPLALLLLAAELVNILTFHITMMPAGLPLPLVVTLLWFIVAWPLRTYFAPLFVAKV